MKKEEKAKLIYTPPTPQNTIIAFDLHDVIVKYDYRAIVKTFFKHDKKLKFFIALLNPFFWKDVIKLKLQKAVPEQFIIQLGKKYKRLTPYIPLGIKIANCQNPDPRMIELLKQLKNQGYTLHLFSNIGATILQDLKQKFPDIIAYFDNVTIPSQENGYTRKPYQHAFEHYLAKHVKKDEQVIFIDDKKRNIKMAEKVGIIGIRFCSPRQLKSEFRKLAIIQ